MAFNKSKALESALKFLNQGKVAQAIGEYQQILRHDPKDQATLMTVGDLFARQGDMTQAIEYFERLAQVYLSDGFNSKAIAIYKKIAKLAPAEMAPLERLADLYVQQGVLSEARPLFIQIAEAHLKANRSVKAVEVLHRLLEVEPENPRVQMRLAELYNVMGQKKEAAQTYLSYAQRLFERNENEEAQKLIDRALEVDATNPVAILLKGRILATLKKNDHAIKVLETHPEADAGAEVTDLIIDLELESGRPAKAVDRARKQLARGHAHFAQLHKVTDAMIEAGQMADVLSLLGELRGPMIEAGKQDEFLKSLTTATERAPGETEGLEMLVDFCRHTSDPFRLSAALGQLADAYADAGNFARAEELLQELVDRNKNDERLVERLNQLRARAGGGSAPAQPEAVDVAAPPSTPQPIPESFVSVSAPTVEAEPPAQPDTPPPLAILEEELDEETQRYVAQALTDVDLFSSYGLTQKATHLLENVLQRAPRHTPTLERLLDLYLGGGNERRTAETASLLEQIHRERNDTVNADRFAELRQRFQKVAGISQEDLPTAPPAVAPTPAATPVAEAQVSIQAAPEIEVPVEAPVGATPRPVVAPSTAEFEIALTPPEPEQAAEPSPAASPAAHVAPEAEAVAPAEEVDLSDEWEAMAQEVAQSTAAPVPEKVASAPEPEPSPEPIAANEPEPEPEPEQVEAEAFIIDETPEPEPEPEPEPVAEAVPMQDAAPEPAIEPSIELIEEPVAASPADADAASNGDFELELAPEPSHSQKSGPLTTEDLISELVAEIDGMDSPSATAEASNHEPIAAPEPVAPAPVAVASTRPPAKAKAAPPPPPPVVQEPVPEVTAESLNQLAEVFQEFRSELGEMGDEDEDLETHYNLGIAYREMGLLDEAIGEFQKVAKAIQKGKPFAYEMNCSTLLAVSFMDKGEPKIASVWYRRALETPGLEQESVLALRYDLGLALESAGESKDALDSFQQVYAMNIDYRDVADRISVLQKQESHV
ncbi:MAG TPA: tetratricopeptide repeat protein [Candidatus Acidoferrales bacterium]|nr:tetratricopeptide repeat protein [Candidatus Acidoferrales bacterium]